MQPVSAVSRSPVLKQAPGLLWQAQQTAQKLQDPEQVPEWMTKAQPPNKVGNSDVDMRDPEPTPAKQNAQKKSVSGVTYNLFIGTNLPLYSSANQETKLRNMHEPNHRELRISKLAARVADMLWPGCQDDIDEALAKHKVMQSQKRIHEEEPVYEPPEVPHVLPFTNWLRNSKEIRESFICTEETRYKPRLAWYNPNDGMIPSGWFTEGLMGDLKYYKPFTGLRTENQKW